MKSKIISLILIIFLILPIVNAITGSIGNAKAIIKTEVKPGETTVIERTILVKNVNDVPINITLEVDENLKDIVELFDEKFVLQPNEEQKARFNINIERPGNYSGKISVFFTPQEKGNGVVLSSSLIIHAYGEGDFPAKENKEDIDEENDTIENNPEQTDEDNETGVKISVGGSKEDITSKSSINNNLVFIIIMVIILLIIIGGAIYFLRKW